MFRNFLGSIFTGPIPAFFWFLFSSFSRNNAKVVFVPGIRTRGCRWIHWPMAPALLAEVVLHNPSKIRWNRFWGYTKTFRVKTFFKKLRVQNELKVLKASRLGMLLINFTPLSNLLKTGESTKYFEKVLKYVLTLFWFKKRNNSLQHFWLIWCDVISVTWCCSRL